MKPSHPCASQKSPAAELPTVGIAVLTILLSSCHSVLPYKMGGNPANLPAGAGVARVTLEMGKPTTITEQNGNRGQIWHYVDYWWDKPGWANRWGTWDLEMRRMPNGFLHLQSWQMVEPPGQEGLAFSSSQSPGLPPGMRVKRKPDSFVKGRVAAGSVRSIQHLPLE